MIKTFADKRTKQFFEGERVREFEGFASQARRRLSVLDTAGTLRTLQRLPSNRFEALKGDRVGRYSIRITAQWRICFAWQAEEKPPTGTDPLDGQGDAVDVEIVDYY